jgi:hypothetical protein
MYGAERRGGIVAHPCLIRTDIADDTRQYSPLHSSSEVEELRPGCFRFHCQRSAPPKLACPAGRPQFAGIRELSDNRRNNWCGVISDDETQAACLDR